jgi:hypothetical protein
LERAIQEKVYGAERELARLLETGRGVDKDLARARALYVAAAEGNPWAARDAGRAFASGDGAPADPASAATWYRQAVEGGVPWAAWDLAKLFEAGTGVTRDRTEALILYATAISLSDDGNLARLVGEATAPYSEQEYTMAAQILAARRGQNPGPADGVMGAGTAQAIANVFAARGLPPPGTPLTIADLAILATPE